MSNFNERAVVIDFSYFWVIFPAAGPLCAVLAAAATPWF